MSYFHPASFRFAWGIIKAMEWVLVCQNWEVQDVLMLVRLQVKYNIITPVVVTIMKNYKKSFSFLKIFLWESGIIFRNLSFSLYFVFGKENVNSVPTPSVLVRLIFSLCALIISFTIESPSPVPFLSLPLELSIL